MHYADVAKRVARRAAKVGDDEGSEVPELEVSEHLAGKSDLSREMSLALCPVDRLLADRYDIVCLLYTSDAADE